MRYGPAAALSLALLISAIFTPASADIGKEHLRYLERWTSGETSRSVIQNLGPPDFVILPTDNLAGWQDMRESGTARQLVWSVKGCQPVTMDFNVSNRSTGIDYTALAQDGRNCVPELERLLTPAPSHSCKLESRKAFCD